MNVTTYSRLAALLLPAAILMAAPQAPMAHEEDENYQGEAPERYAMVRSIEGEVRIRKGELEESLSRGTPIAEGDVVESRGRGVLQLGDGTRVAFAGATRFTVAALFTDRKNEKQVLLRLDYGRLRVVLGGQSDARFRVDTPSGSATCFDKGGFTLEAERDKVVRLKVHSGRVTFSNERDEARITAGERLTVYSPQDGLDRVRGFNTYDGDDFDRWSDQAIIVKRGESWDRVPSEIRYYADELDNHGRWVQSEEFGSVWQPTGVAEDWRPYYQGRWAPYSGGMTWVSDEPWAYVAYHHGRWHWSLGIGWCWIPGVHYSPAWVAWNRTPGYYGWAPLGYYNTPCHWGYGAWGGGYAWNVVSVTNINVINVNRHMHSDVNVLRTFGGNTTWRGNGRELSAPWQRSPLMVTHAEFRNPAQIETVFRRDVNRERMGTYERQAQSTTGRVVLRDLTPVRPVSGAPVGSTPDRTSFVDRERRGRLEQPSPITRDLGAPQQPSRPIENRRPESPRVELPRPTPRVEAPRAEPARPAPHVEAPRVEAPRPTQRFEDRPKSMEERRPDPVVRERNPEPRFRPEREERRPEAPRPEERRPEPPRPAERHQEQPRPVERESRPAPRPEPAREKAREEKKPDNNREQKR